MSRRSRRRRALVAGAAARSGRADAELNDLGVEPALHIDGPGRSACQRLSRRTRRICQEYTSVVMQSIAAVPAVATTPTTAAIMSQTLGVTSTWSGGRGSGMQTIREGGSGCVEVAGSRDSRGDLVLVGYRVTDTVRHARGTTAGGCGLQVIHSCVAAAGRAADLTALCDLLDPHGERSCAGPRGPDSARPSRWAVAGHVTGLGVGGLDPHGCGRIRYRGSMTTARQRRP
jgi:hypothetical protein